MKNKKPGIEFWLLGIVVGGSLFFVFTGLCCGFLVTTFGPPPERPVASPLPPAADTSPATPEAKPAIPEDVEITLLDSDVRPGHKRSLTVALSRKVTEDELKSIALAIKDADPNTYPRTFIRYAVPGNQATKTEMMKVGSWASTDFIPELRLQIHGLTIEQEHLLRQLPDDPTRSVIGCWLHDEVMGGVRLTLIQRGDDVYLEKAFGDGSKGESLCIEFPSDSGRKFMDAEKTGPLDDFYLLRPDGDLEIWSKSADDAITRYVTMKPMEPLT